MLRAALAVFSAVLLVTVLGVLIVESRAVSEDYFAAHGERLRAIETSRDDLSTILQGAESAFEDGRQVSSSMTTALTRLEENNLFLQGDDERLEKSDESMAQATVYDERLRVFLDDGRAFALRQNELARALRTLQEESPVIVKDLRRFDLRLQSQNAFTLAINIIEFSTGDSDLSARELTARVDALANDRRLRSEAPGVIDEFISAARAVIEQRTSAGDALDALAANDVVDELWALSNIIRDDNRRTVSRAEMAGLLLSVCTILVLVGAGYALYRLQDSYRDLNRSNYELENMNNSLEERVTDRTHKLSEAYDDLKESQVQLVQAEKMSSLGELVAGISHEINTPLWYLISNSTVLQERMDSVSEFAGVAERMLDGVKSGENLKEAVSRGLKDMQRMLNDGFRDDIDEARDLINDSIEGLEELTELAQSLKDFSRLDRARHGEFDVNEGLDKTLLIAKNRLKNKATIHKHYGEVPVIHCSPSQINQVFLNLLTNAADALEESGEIVIRTLADDDKVRVSVADTGCGIPEDLLAKIRDPFFTTKEVGKGTGLGLSIVEQIVSSHGGELIIESEQGRGTTVTVVLPIVATIIEADDEEPVATTEEAPAAANDDDGVVADEAVEADADMPDEADDDKVQEAATV
ncbi:MAG: ATP-binding protein [Woeseiaceae bacterium]|nr:ATP-binding protein [Woeseiaceae bacterium]